MRVPVALGIAGSDSSGGAGLQADTRTFHAHGVHGATVVTAITAQNTRGVAGFAAVPPALVAAQLDAVLFDLRPGAAKTGMLASPATVRIVARALAPSRLPLVVDPVLVAHAGGALAERGLLQALRGELLPRAALLTPNIPEAEALLGHRIATAEAMHEALVELQALGPRAVLLKGGHLPRSRGTKAADAAVVVDAFLDERKRLRTFAKPRLSPHAGHGGGCTLSAAITANLAQGQSLAVAVARAEAYAHEARRAALNVGHGRWPVGQPFPAEVARQVARRKARSKFP